MRPLLPCLTVLAAVCMISGMHANEPQALSAKIDGAAFAADDDTILLVPLPHTFVLQAATAGAAAYPPPKTPIDRLSITCTMYTPGQPVKLTSKDFSSATCNATFSKAAREAGKAATEYVLDKDSPVTLFEITAAHDKVIEGRFAFHMKSKAGAALAITEGHFVAEDRQL